MTYSLIRIAKQMQLHLQDLNVFYNDELKKVTTKKSLAVLRLSEAISLLERSHGKLREVTACKQEGK